MTSRQKYGKKWLQFLAGLNEGDAAAGSNLDWRLQRHRPHRVAGVVNKKRTETMTIPEKNKKIPIKQALQYCQNLGLHELGKKVKAEPPKNDFVYDGCTCWFDKMGKAGFRHKKEVQYD